jgi:hypothetical protein
VGLPHVVGLLAGLPFGRLAHRLAPPGRLYIAFSLVDILNGAGCVAAAVLLFRLLGLQVTSTLPLVLGARSCIYYLPRHQFLMGACHVVGIFTGWMIYIHLVTA